MRELTSPQFAIANAILPANYHHEERQQHPHLENLYVMCRRERIPPNAIVDIETEFFSGRMILMFRTPDADADADDGDDDYFRGTQRRFEFQWQLRLKKLVPGDVYVGMEVDEPIKLGLMQRALANVALKFTKRTNQVRCTGGTVRFLLPYSATTRQYPPRSLPTVFLQGFSYRISDSADKGPSRLSFPVGTFMDRFNATNIGEPLPSLGRAIYEDPEVTKQRMNGAKIEWSTDYVYTMALWSGKRTKHCIVFTAVILPSNIRNHNGLSLRRLERLADTQLPWHASM